MNKKHTIRRPGFIKSLLMTPLILLLVLVLVNIVNAATGYVDPSNKWAWGTNIGWINFNPTHGGVDVYDDHLEGYVWAENVGWIRLGTYDGGGSHTYANDAAGTYGVNNDGLGNLSGYAWSTNTGWINFRPTHGGVTVDPSTGEFCGYAWGENVGWIHFNGGSGSNAYRVVNVPSLKVMSGGIAANTQTIENGAVLYGDIKQITVTFNKDVYNPAGSSNEDDVTNPANYLLFQSGEDEVFDTVDCASVPGVDPNDQAIPVGPVTYSNNGGSGPFVATVTVNNGNKLPLGEYHLLVCGTTSIVDTNLSPLAGDGVTPGSDQTTIFRISSAGLPATGFRPGSITALPAQSADEAYMDTAMTLEIPKLGVSTPIIGVPQTLGGWNVTWLGSEAGYLEGTAFPTWNGNTVITGHVWDSFNRPSVFSDLKELNYGDRMQIHAWDMLYTYEVRATKVVAPDDLDVVFKAEELDWLTLITCEHFDEAADQYLSRRMVRAVLIDAQPVN
jgi:LPXTG-site transpeptidase (sortase) family protein